MKPIFTLFAIAVSYCGVAQTEAKFVKNHLIIKIKEANYRNAQVNLLQNKLGILKLDNLNLQLGIDHIEQIGQHQKTRTFLLISKDKIDPQAVAQAYKNTGMLDYAEPDFIGQGGGEKMTSAQSQIIPSDTRFNRQWGFYNPGTQAGIGNVTADADVDMELAWDIQTGDPDMVIAVSDSGLRLNHPDIASRVWTNPADSNNGNDDDANGLVDDYRGWDWVNNDNDPTDDMGHGTNVAGIIGAVANNNNLYAGGNWNSKLMILKVLGVDNSATYSAMANSIYYASAHGAKIFSMSIGGGDAQIIRDAVSDANDHNMIFVACMMNFDNNTAYYPAAYSATFPNVIAVGSSNPDDTRTAPFFWSSTSGSNFGSHLNVVAPGNYAYGLDYQSDTNAGSYWGGTSQATPLVASIASLIWAENPSLTPQQVRTVLENTAEDQVGNPIEDVAGFDQYMGHGRVNAHLALQSVLSVQNSRAVVGQEFQIINPASRGTLQVMSMGQYPGNYDLVINTIDGKSVQTKEVSVSAGINKLPFDYPTGNYIVTLKSAQYIKIFKVVVE